VNPNFVAAAVRRYADAFDSEEGEIVEAADQGIADIEAGRFEWIAGADDMQRLRAELDHRLDQARGTARASRKLERHFVFRPGRIETLTKSSDTASRNMDAMLPGVTDFCSWRPWKRLATDCF
jgi:hypothetical protein